MIKNKRNFLIYIPIVLLPVMIFSESLFQLKALYWGTAGLQFIPWRMFIWNSLSDGVSPLWNPLSGMGAPLIANYQTALFYPPGWLLYLFAAGGGSSWMAWAHTIMLVAHLIWAGTGMARLLRRLRFRSLSQVVGAISFAVGGYFIARSGFFSMVWTASWLPWILLGASQIATPVKAEGKSTAPFLSLGLAVAVAMMLLAGHAQLSWYILLLALLWVLVGGWIQKGFQGGVHAFLRYGTAVGIGVVLASIQLLPTAEYLLQSQRSGSLDYETALSYSFWPWRFLTLFFPDLYGNPGFGNYWGYGNYWEDAIYMGVLPVMLAFTTVGMLWKRRQEISASHTLLVRFGWGVTIIGFLLALGKNTPIFPFLYTYVPTFDIFNAPARWLIWSLLGISLLAAIGVDHWRTPTGKGLYWLRLGTAGGFAVTLGAFLAWFLMPGINLTFIRAMALAGMWALGTGLLTLFMPTIEKPHLRYAWQCVVIGWLCLDLFVAGWALNPTIDKAFYQSTTDHADIGLQGKRIYLSVDNDDYLKFRRFFRFEDFRWIEDPMNLRRVFLPNLNLLDGIHSANNFDPLVPVRYASWMQHLNTLTDEERLNWLRLMNVGMEELLDMHESLGVRFLPVEGSERLRFFTCAVYVDGEEAAFHQVGRNLSQGNFDTIVLEVNGIPGDCAHGSGEEKIELLVDQPGKILIRSVLPSAGWIFLADTWYPGWEAYVNGKKAEVYRANYLFKAVSVSGGINEIEFLFRPASFYAGAFISGVGWFIVLISIIMCRVSYHSNKKGKT